jgi:hypothetical protein
VASRPLLDEQETISLGVTEFRHPFFCALQTNRLEIEIAASFVTGS